LFVSSISQFSTNAWVRLLLDNINNGLLADLHSNLIPADAQFNNKLDVVQFNFKITEVNGDVQARRQRRHAREHEPACQPGLLLRRLFMHPQLIYHTRVQAPFS
jgi:hypothetical protein